MTRMRVLTAAMALALGSSAAQAAILFDPDGFGSGGAAVPVGSFDWDFSSVLIQNGNQAVANFIANAQTPGLNLDTTFTVYAHAILANTKNDNGVINTPSGLNTSYEISMTLAFKEQVTGVLGNIAAFSFLAGEPNWIKMYYDPAKNASALQGWGYDDGTLIMSSDIAGPSTGNFTATNTVAPLSTLDQTPNGDQWNGQLTVDGFGSQNAIPIDVDLLIPTLVLNPNFWQYDSITRWRFENLSLLVPFGSADPSKCYDGSAADGTVTVGVVNNASNACQSPGVGALTANIGTINGGLPIGDGGGGPDLIIQTDYNANIIARVPEPSIIALMGAGLLLMGGTYRRRVQNV